REVCSMVRSIWTKLLVRNRLNAARLRRTAESRRQRPTLETLEARETPAAVATTSFILHSHGGASSFGSPGPTGLSPAQIAKAYGIDQITFANGTVAGDGSGTTIAIVDAFDDPNIASDLHNFDVAFGLPDPVFTKLNQSGGSTMPAGDVGW